jgi:hypothetical protein
MTWIKLDDRVPSHPKIGGLSDKAFRWWVNSLCYASEYLTDGALPRVFWRRVPNKIRTELIDSKLWRFADPDLEICGYLEHQQSREVVENERRRNRDRRNSERGTTERRTVGTTAGTTRGTPAEKPRPDTEIEIDTDTEKNKDRASRSDERFESWWMAYPKKTGKGAALKAFTKIRPTDETLRLMLTALDWQRTQPQWTKDGGAYIPNPATYLNQSRWEDEPFFTETTPAEKSITQQIEEWARS